MPPFDVFLVLKLDDPAYDSMLNDDAGVNGLIESIHTIRPRRVILFDRYKDTVVNSSPSSSQLSTIDKSFDIAEAHGVYDYVIRY